MEKPLSTAEAAAYLKTGKRAVQHLIKRGRLPAEKLGRDWFVTREALEQLVRKKGWPKGKPRKPRSKGERTRTVRGSGTKPKPRKKKKG
jgi:excisionase family DNA binding protein